MACSGHDENIKYWQAWISRFSIGRNDYNDESELAVAEATSTSGGTDLVGQSRL